MNAVVYLLFAALFGCGFVSTASLKFCSRFTEHKKGIYPLNTLITGVIACGFFWAVNGFCIALNPRTVVYALFLAVLSLACQVCSLIIYRYLSVAAVTVVQVATSIVVTLAVGVTAFGEAMTVMKGVRVGLMLVAVSLMYLSYCYGKKKDQAQNAQAPSPRFRFFPAVPLLMLMAADSALATLTYSAFAKDAAAGTVTDQNSFCFFTNAILIGVAIVWFFAVLAADRRGTVDCIRAMKPIDYGAIAVTSLSSNANTLVAIVLVGMVDVSLYTPISSAVGIISAASVSFLFREKQNVFSIISVLLAAATVALPEL